MLSKDYAVAFDPETGRMHSPPRQVFIEITSRCNLICVHCPKDFGAATGPEPMDMKIETVERLKEFVDHADTVNLNVVGEPLIHPEFERIMELTNTGKPNITFNTNGMMLEPEFCRKLTGTSLGFIVISVDGMESNMAVRGVPYRVIRQKIANLCAAREAAGSKYPRIGLAYTLMRRNLQELPGVLEDLLPLGIEEVHLQPVIVYYTTLLNENVYDVSEAVSVLKRCKSICSKNGARFRLFRSRIEEDERFGELNDDGEEERTFQLGQHSKQYGCIDPFYEIKICSDGSVMACSYGRLPGLNVHDLGAEAIWNHGWYQDLRRRLYGGEFSGRCEACPYVFGSTVNQVSNDVVLKASSVEGRFLRDQAP